MSDNDSNKDTKLDTLKMLKDASSKFSMPLDMHKQMANDLDAICIIVEEWKKVKETKAEEQK